MDAALVNQVLLDKGLSVEGQAKLHQAGYHFCQQLGALISMIVWSMAAQDAHVKDIKKLVTA